MARKGIFFPTKDAALRDDVHALGQARRRRPAGPVRRRAVRLVEGDRQAAIGRRLGEAEDSVELVVRAQGRSAPEARELIRAFTSWFQVVNIAEKVHRVRRRRQYMNDSSIAQPGGLEDVLRQPARARHDVRADRGAARAGERRTGPHIAPDGIHPSDPATPAAARRAPDARRTRPCAYARGAARVHRARAHGNHDRLADRRQLARTPHGGGRARARAVLHRRGDLRSHSRRSTRRSRRRSSRSSASWWTGSQLPIMLQLRLVGGRRHGRPPRRTCQDDPRELRRHHRLVVNRYYREARALARS